MKNIFDVNRELFNLSGYAISYIEFFGVLSGFIAVWLSAKANIWNWPVGLINVVLSFLLYYQVQLYPDMFLQLFFFITNIIGWWRWANPKPGEEDKKHELKVSYMKPQQLISTFVIGLSGTFLLGKMAGNLHMWFPNVFSLPGAYPYTDSFITVMSIVTTFYVIQKKIECWIIWIVVDIVATYLYYIKEVKFYSVEYFIFTLLAAYGFINWRKEYRKQTRSAI